MQINVPSWDLFIGLFFIIGVSYGFILQREKVIATLVSVYASMVITQVVSPVVLDFFSGDKTLFNSVFIKAHTSPFTVQAIVFAVVIVLLTVKGGLHAARARGFLSSFDVAVYSFLNSALILAAILGFLDPELRQAFAEQSKFARYIVTYQNIWIIAPVVYMIIEGFRHGRRYSPISEADF